MNNWFKQNGVHIGIIGVFIAICFFYFTPAFQGKTIGQNDVTRAQSTQKEIMDYRDKGTTILWTNQILGGMPAFQVWAPYSSNITGYVISAVTKAIPSPVGIVLLLMLGAYFLFSVLGLSPWLAAGGALAFSFSSYNFIYLVAGHANQELAIAFFAPILASIILILRGRYWVGAPLLALFLALEIKANHIQMTYYLLIALIILTGFELYNAIKSKQTATFLKSFAYMGGALLLALAVNASVLWSTFEYSGDTIRGKSNLTRNTTEPGNGVSRDYAYEFSEGVGETLSFMVPNIYGGASVGDPNPDSHVVKALTDRGADINQAQNIAQQMPSYWGEKTFTEGPWYFGAVICFLFIFGLLIVKNRIKWWLLTTVLLTMLLSFGKNFPFVSDIFFNYFPLYNKFRAVESILTITSLCFPILAFLALDEAIKATDKKLIFKKLKIALYICGGLALLLAAIPDTLLAFHTSNHAEFVNQLTHALNNDATIGNAIANGLIQDRIALARADAFRALIFILIAFALIWAYINQKLNTTIFSLVFLFLVLIDMWSVDKRYLKDTSFVDPQDIQKPQPRVVDQFILRDTDPDFRVIDLTVPLLQDASTPYFHKSIGGYSAARLKRYDELVEAQLSKSINQDVLDMLNTKYIIAPSDQKGQNLTVRTNATACGHAWFVKHISFAKNADDEMKAISAFMPKNEAIVDDRYRNLIDTKQLGLDTSATMKLTDYQPDHMTYQSSSAASQVAVFSEIYYDKGWKMLIDGVEKPYFRADYVLRAAQIPAGSHKVEFIFHPASYYTGETISLAGSILLLLALGGAGYSGLKKKEDEHKPAGKKS